MAAFSSSRHMKSTRVSRIKISCGNELPPGAEEFTSLLKSYIPSSAGCTGVL